MKKRYIIIGIIIGIIIIGGIIAMIINNSKKENINQDEDKYSKGTHHAQITIKDYGTINVELYADIAPITVANFAKLVNEGFYNGLTFHRIISGFMIQGGDPNGNGTGGSDENIKGEFAQNGFKNTLKHSRGVLSMARSMMPDSAGSQFFIMHEDAPHLDGSYAAFGKVLEGMEVVDYIARVATDFSDRPLTPVVMKKVTVDTKGENFEEPTKL